MKLYANPYDISRAGFYFESLAEYEAGVKAFGAEEYMIDFIDADFDERIFAKMKVSQGNIGESFERAEQIEALDVEEMTALAFLLDCGYSLDVAFDKLNEVCITKESLDNYAHGLMTECYDVPDNLLSYMDYRKFGRDLLCGGSVVELNGYLITNANDF